MSTLDDVYSNEQSILDEVYEAREPKKSPFSSLLRTLPGLNVPLHKGEIGRDTWGGEIERALVRGGKRVKGAVPGTTAWWLREGGDIEKLPLPGLNIPAFTPKGWREDLATEKETEARRIYESTLDPELAPRKGGVSGYIVNTVAETIPSAAAAMAAGAVTGPAGAFIVGGAVESEAHVQEAMQASGKTEEELAAERMIVFIISGAIERMQIDEALEISKANLKPLIAAAKDRAWKKIGKEVGRLSAKHAAGAASEAIEEVLQEATSIGVASLHGEKIATIENLKRLGGAAGGGTVGYVGLGLAGAGARTALEGGVTPIDWTKYDNPETAVQEEAEYFVPEPRVMPHADTTDPEGETVIESEFRYGPRKPKELTTEEQATLERLEEEPVEPEPKKEEEPEAEAEGTVAPELYIGNVTGRAKKVWADEFNLVREREGIPGKVEPTDIGPHREGPFPTKRTRVELSRSEAEETLAQMEETLEEELLKWPEAPHPSQQARSDVYQDTAEPSSAAFDVTEPTHPAVGETTEVGGAKVSSYVGPEGGASSSRLALLNALWGDIRNVRAALGKPVGQRPFRVNTRGNQIVVEIKSPGQRVMEAIRGPGKKTLAEYNHKQLVTQGEALRGRLKAVARSAAKAWRQGNKEGIRRLRRHLRALRAKQRALQMIRQHRRRLVDRITAPVSDNVDPLYAKAIRTMAGALDPKGRSQETQKALADLQRAIEADPTLLDRIKSPKGLKLLERLSQIPSTEISTDQLQELLKERLRLDREGRMKRKQRLEQLKAKPTTESLIKTLKGKKQRLSRRVRGEYNHDWVKKLSHRFNKGVFRFGLGQYRIDRFFEWLDGFEVGTFTDQVWRPMKRLALESTVRRNLKRREYYSFLRSHGIDGASWNGDKVTFELSDGGSITLSKWEMIGVYQLAQSENGRSHLMESPLQQELRKLLEQGKITEQQFYAQWFGHKGKLTKEDLNNYKQQLELQSEARKNLSLSEADIEMISGRVAADEQMRTVADWQLEQLGERWDSIVQTAREIGMDPTKLVKVGKYMPLLLKNVDLMDQDDLLQRALGEFIPEDYQVERKFLEKRKKGADAAVELDANLLFTHSLSEVEHFLTMAPKLAQLSHIMSNDKFRESLNNSTYGMGVEMVAKWIVDTARGRVVREHDWIARHVHKLNRNGVIYALGYNIPVVVRQTISTLNGLAMNPKLIGRWLESIVYNAHPKDYDALQEKVRSKSTLVAERDMEHHIADLWNKSFLRKQMQREFGHKVKGFQFSKSATSWIRKMDLWTVTHVWNSAYEMAIENGATEQQAINYADQNIQRTQPMARPEDLPHFFRGGALQQLFTVFQNQVNQNLNFWIHDIYGARKYGKISNAEVAYRVMMAYTLPAIVFGMIGRGFAPPDEEQLIEDLVVYGGGTPLIFGNAVRHAITGWGNSLGLWQTGIEGLADAAASAREGDFRGVLKNASKAIAVSPVGKGAPTAAMIRGTEGAYDLWNGSTDDPRRLMWSEWALEQGKPEEDEERKTRKRKRRRRRTRR